MDGDKRGGPGPQAGSQGKTPVRVKKIGHFVYEVSDIERSVKFWTEVMGFEVTERNELGIVFLHYGADHHGIGLIATDAKRKGELPASKLQHLALEVESVEALLAAREYLKRNNVPIVFEGRKGAGSNYGLNFLDPDGNQFELYCEMDQLGFAGVRPRSHWRRAKSLEEAIAKPLSKTW